jgi:benzoyl-CoA reductase subunit D
VEQVERGGGTGAGSKSISRADVTFTEIRAAAIAARYFFPDAVTVVDVGAEACRVSRLAQSGTIEDFAVNEKCAAGAGAFIEAMARALETPLDEMGDLALSSNRSIPIQAQCVIFAESEVVGLIHAKTPAHDIAKAVLDSMAGRIVSMIRRVGVNRDIVVMGGVARNSAVIRAIQADLGGRGVLVPEQPEFGGAVGAAFAASQHDIGL